MPSSLVSPSSVWDAPDGAVHMIIPAPSGCWMSMQNYLRPRAPTCRNDIINILTHQSAVAGMAASSSDADAIGGQQIFLHATSHGGWELNIGLAQGNPEPLTLPLGICGVSWPGLCYSLCPVRSVTRYRRVLSQAHWPCAWIAQRWCHYLPKASMK